MAVSAVPEEVKSLFNKAKDIFDLVVLGEIDMGKLFPFRSEVDVDRRSSRVLSLTESETHDIFDALASETSRNIYRQLYEEPTTASNLAKQVDTSVQNVRYHLDKLTDAGLIQQVDTWYSSRGNEMAVYSAADEALIVAGDEQQTSELRTALEGTIGAVLLLAAASLLIDWVVFEFFAESVSTTENVLYATGFDADPGLVSQSTDSSGSVIPESIRTLRPGVVAFVGGLAAIGAVLVVNYALETVRR